jgi:hypothetical protein
MIDVFSPYFYWLIVLTAELDLSARCCDVMWRNSYFFYVNLSSPLHVIYCLLVTYFVIWPLNAIFPFCCDLYVHPLDVLNS